MFHWRLLGAVSPMLATLLLLLVHFPSADVRGDEAELKSLLSQPILAPDTPQAEVEAYCDGRIPRMPKVDSREQWERIAQQVRHDMLAKVVLRGAAAEWSHRPPNVEWLETIDGGEGYRIKKLRYEAVPGLFVPALLYEPLQLSGKVPVVMNVNGHDRDGKAADYKQIRCINQARRGMLALNVEWLGMGQLRGEGFTHYRMNQLDLCGTSGLAPYYLSMTRGLDVLLSHPHADPERVAVAGLSGGGWQTIFISSLDTRVTLCNPVAGYSSFITRVHNHSDLGDSEQTPCDMATVADYIHLTALLAPRTALLTFNLSDNCCFAAPHALPPLLQAVKPIYQLYGRESELRYHINADPGNHNFGLENREALYAVLGQRFLGATLTSQAVELECQSEVKSAEQLAVDLPAENSDFHQLAEQLAKGLPRTAAAPAEPEQLAAWQEQQRGRLAELARTKELAVSAEKAGQSSMGEVTVQQWRLKLGGQWTVPAVELSPPAPKETVIIVADEGRESIAAEAMTMLAAGRRVIAVDPFYIGESKIRSRPFLFALLVSAIGDRPVGLQASQLAAIARWRKSLVDEPVQLVSRGERLGLAALIGAAIEPRAIDSVKLHQSLKSLHQVIEKNYSVDRMPELFCFGLLAEFDIDRLDRLVAPREVIR